ncbi:hypothetical protein [Kitasatospora sp. NPDC005856]|uniref:hypothetical protein n=1 Tax=Kitasatospora sp. NPDC005856 TaxID=3154566 RepID=UPI0033F3080A
MGRDRLRVKAHEEARSHARDDNARTQLFAHAAEVFRDLKNPKTALAWNAQAAAMPTGVFTRSVGMRLAIVGTAHLQGATVTRASL